MLDEYINKNTPKQSNIYRLINGINNNYFLQLEIVAFIMFNIHQVNDLTKLRNLLYIKT